MSEEQREGGVINRDQDAATVPDTEKRSYRTYHSGGELQFDPMKDLNLPASYDEVLARFRRLQGARAMESLN